MSPKQEIQITVVDEATAGPCACCGSMNRTVSGEARVDGLQRATYYVQWKIERALEDAVFFIILGPWDRDVPAERVAVALKCRMTKRGPGFMVINAANSSWGAAGKRAGTHLQRDQVVGTPLAADVFAIADEVMYQDSRVRQRLADAYKALVANAPKRWWRRLRIPFRHT